MHIRAGFGVRVYYVNNGRCSMMYGLHKDATIFDSNHRGKYLKNGELDLED